MIPRRNNGVLIIRFLTVIGYCERRGGDDSSIASTSIIEEEVGESSLMSRPRSAIATFYRDLKCQGYIKASRIAKTQNGVA